MSKAFLLSILALCISCLLLATAPPGFKDDQLKYPRVREAFQEKETIIHSTLRKHKLEEARLQIMLLAFKEEKELQLWARNSNQPQYQLIKTYDFCSFSGILGPKRRQGDYQIPEGLYHIDRFNPSSSYHLSLGINYPNKSDQILSSAAKKGGDIFIHGDCVTIGCIPITDDKIKELYAYAVMAKDQGQEKIPVAIFPARMTLQKMAQLKSRHPEDKALLHFWQNLKDCHDRILAEKLIPNYSIDAKGKYVMK